MPFRALTVTVLLALSGAAVANDADGIKATLDTAKERYEGEMTRYRLAVKEYFDKEEEGARGKGDLKLVERVAADRKAFEQTDTLPPSAPLALRQKPAAARATLAAAYAVAIKEYVRAKKDAEATELSKQLDDLKAAGAGAPGGPGQKALFNGKDLKGWVVDGGTDKQWKVIGGEVVGVSPTYKTRSYLLTGANYSNYVLSLEYKTVGDDVSAGVAIRGQVGENMPYPGGGALFDHPLVKLTTGNKSEKEPTGTSHWVMDTGLYTLPRAKAELRAGGWNTLTVTVDGKKCKVEVNAKVVSELTLADDIRGKFVPGLGRLDGRIGLQVNTGEIRFRNIYVQPLTGVREEK